MPSWVFSRISNISPDTIETNQFFVTPHSSRGELTVQVEVNVF